LWIPYRNQAMPTNKFPTKLLSAGVGSWTVDLVRYPSGLHVEIIEETESNPTPHIVFSRSLAQLAKDGEELPA